MPKNFTEVIRNGRHGTDMLKSKSNSPFFSPLPASKSPLCKSCSNFSVTGKPRKFFKIYIFAALL